VTCITVTRADTAKLSSTSKPMEPVMSQHVEREPTNQVTELTADEMERASGGFLAFTFKLVAVKTVSWAHDDEAPKQK
jgi:hypothetical protein